MSSTENLTGDEYDDYVYSWVYPNPLEMASIPIFVILLIVGLVGNFLVIFVVIRNESMRTVTNFFLVNLACADFLVLLFCLPFTVLWDITNTWWFGLAMCKIIVYLQTVSISVSVITLTCISVERWYAICNPLSFKSTFERTLLILILTWAASLVISFPELVILELRPANFTRENFTARHLLMQCQDSWDETYQTIYQLCQFGILYIFPLILMAIMYGQIAYVLWVKSVPPSDPCMSVQLTVETSPSGQYRTKTKHSLDHSKEKEIMIRRKAAKMLIAVVLLFAICYFPTHAINILKQTKLYDVPPNIFGSILKLFIRVLCYFNSCVNPIIYNFMSEKFQREFRRACCCFPSKFRTGSASRFSTFGAGENATLLAASRRDQSRIDDHSQHSGYR